MRFQKGHICRAPVSQVSSLLVFYFCSMCLYVCVCEFTCELSTHREVHTHLKILLLSVTLDLFPPYILRQGVLLSLELTIYSQPSQPSCSRDSSFLPPVGQHYGWASTRLLCGCYRVKFLMTTQQALYLLSHISSSSTFFLRLGILIKRKLTNSGTMAGQ